VSSDEAGWSINKMFNDSAIDVATECYCYTEDAAITTGIGAAVVVVGGAMIVASGMASGEITSDNAGW
jgi:hypothetical protein